MKTYLFNTEHGLYEGESYVDAAMLQYEEGITPIPPPGYEHGQVPVFDRRKNDWAVILFNLLLIHNLLIYGVGGMVASFVGIKVIDIVIGMMV